MSLNLSGISMAAHNQPLMKVISLQSGSNGNCIYVEAEGVKLLFDAGISGIRAQERLAAHGRDITSVDAVLISHDHRDHTSCMGIYQRKFGLPLCVTRDTLETASAKIRVGEITEVQFFAAGDALRFDGVSVETIPTPHDGVDGVAFVVDDGQRRLGILTDLGHTFRGLKSILCSLDAVVLESNYDPKMLADGSYPPFLKERISGPYGHLSNQEAAELLAAAGGRLKWACLAHLSEENNTPRCALNAHRKALGKEFPLHVATRYEATGVLEV
ncbi:MAG: MBL fold metallo-hydrolase [Pirellulaceae bacterium]